MRQICIGIANQGNPRGSPSGRSQTPRRTPRAFVAAPVMVFASATYFTTMRKSSLNTATIFVSLTSALSWTPEGPCGIPRAFLDPPKDICSSRSNNFCLGDLLYCYEKYLSTINIKNPLVILSSHRGLMVMSLDCHMTGPGSIPRWCSTNFITFF